METTGLSEYTGLGSMKRAQMEEESKEVLGDILFHFISKPGVMEGALPVVESIMDRWAGDAFFKKMVVKQAVKQSSKFMADIVDKGRGSEGQLGRNISKLLTLLIELKIDKNHTEDFQASFDKVESSVNEVLSEFDSGLIWELVESSRESGIIKANTIQNIMNANPTKLASVLATLMLFVNNQAEALSVRVDGIREFPPDVMVELMAGVIKFIDGKKVGPLVNSMLDVSHMLHIGSLLLGDSKKSKIQQIVSEQVSGILPHIDSVTFRKSLIGTKENGYAVKNGAVLALADFPEILKEIIESGAVIKNAKYKHLRNKLKVVESLPEEDLADAIENNLETLDAAEIADIVTSFVEIANSVNEQKPNLIGNVLSDFVQTIDIDELEVFAEETVPKVVNAIKPATDAIMPSLINGVCDLLTPSPGDDSGEIQSALSRLGNLLGNGGAK